MNFGKKINLEGRKLKVGGGKFLDKIKSKSFSMGKKSSLGEKHSLLKTNGKKMFSDSGKKLFSGTSKIKKFL